MCRGTAAFSALALALLTVCAPSTGTTGATIKALRSSSMAPGSDELVVNRGDEDLLLITAGGQTLRVLAGESQQKSVALCGSGLGIDPASWSPDGRWLAFSASIPKGTPAPKGPLGCDIYLVAADGTGLQRLTNTYSAVKPVWSPSGNQIVFSVTHRYAVTIEERGRKEHGAYAETARLWSIRPDSSGARPLEPEPHHPATLVNPKRSLEELRRLIKKEGKSKALKRLVERSLREGGHDYAGSFTPDSSHLAFTRLGLQPAIMMMPAAGGSPRLLIHNASEPVVSTDGRLLAFNSARDHNGELSDSEDSSHTATELYVAHADGSHQRRLTHTRSIDELAPAFSRDGSTIAYLRGESVGAAECTAIWEMPASGGPSHPLLADPSCNTWYYDPVWRP